MSYTPVTWTTAGLSAAINAEHASIQMGITHISAGTASYTPNPDQTSLVAEQQKVPVGGGQKLTDTQMQISALFDEHQQYEVSEVGFWSNDLLLTVLSTPGERLNYKSATASWVEIFTLDISPLPQNTIAFTVGTENANLFVTAG